MKKILVLLLLMVYGLSSIGMTLHLHYCCGKLDKIQLSPVAGKHCGNGRQTLAPKSCCDDKEISLKLKSDYNSEKQLGSDVRAQAVPVVQAVSQIFTPVKLTKLLPEVFAPPPLQKDRVSFFCIYRI